MRTNKTSTGRKALFKMFLNKQLKAIQNFKENGEKQLKMARAKKADSPPGNLEQFGLVLAILVLLIVGLFIFVWHTALKRSIY